MRNVTTSNEREELSGCVILILQGISAVLMPVSEAQTVDGGTGWVKEDMTALAEGVPIKMYGQRALWHTEKVGSRTHMNFGTKIGKVRVANDQNG